MPTKLDRKTLPSGTTATSFRYMGRPASDQGDFGADVGIADAVCVNQFGDANNSKYYHGGVVQSTDGRWWVYLEWGRISGSGNSWNGSFSGGDYQFVRCSDESEARGFFAKQMADKNTKRLQQTTIAGKLIWAAKADSDGYLVQRLATRSRGLPDAYAIKDGTGVKVSTPSTGSVVTASSTPAPAAPTKVFQPQVISLAQALVGGTKEYARAASAATGIVPTLAAIEEVRNDCIPTAMTLLGKIGTSEAQQLADKGLQDISKYVASIVPRPIPRGGDPMSILLTAANILSIQQDLDAYESALSGTDFTAAPKSAAPTGYNPDQALNANLRWIDLNSDEGRWLKSTYLAMSNRRHGYLRADPAILNIFAVDRPDRDAQFMTSVRKVAAQRKGAFSLRANLQPKSRTDLGTAADLYAQANVIFTQHGTRSVNVAPITQGHFRMPKQLSGVPIAGANFGHGNYQATDFRKAVGYTSTSGAAWSSGGGVASRGAFMFLCDSIMGDAYRAPSTGSWTTPPNGKDSVFGVGGDRGHSLENDEHVFFDPTYVRIRYLVEFKF